MLYCCTAVLRYLLLRVNISEEQLSLSPPHADASAPSALPPASFVRACAHTPLLSPPPPLSPPLPAGPQKGIHLIEHAVHRTVELGGQFVVLGTGHADTGLRGMAGGVYR